MSGAWWQSDWAVVVALLACEAALIGCVAWFAQRRMRSARRRLIVWQSAMLAVFAVAVGELAGAGPALVKALSQDTPEPWAPQAEVSTGVAIVTEEKPLIRELVEQRLRENQSANPPQLQLQFEEMESLAPVPTPPKASQSMTLGWVWLIGSASLLCLIAGRRVCFWFCSLRFKRVNCPQLRERLETVARRLGVKSRIDLRISHRLTTPAAYGLMRLTVGLPEGFESENSVERQDALLAHELAHLRAADPWWHLGADLLTAALWWQPLVWWIAGSMKSASESAADEASLCVENGPEALAECLVEFGKRLTPRSAASAIGMAGSGYTSRLGQRVEALLKLPPGGDPVKPTFRQTLIRIGGAVLLAGVGLTMVACCAPRSVGDTETPLAMTREAIAAQQPAVEIVVAAAPEPRERIDTAPAKKSPGNRPDAARRVESDLTSGQTLEEARQLEQDAVLFEEGIRLADRGEVANAEAQKRAAIEGLTNTRWAIAKGLLRKRKFPEAIAQMDRLLKFVPTSQMGIAFRGYLEMAKELYRGLLAKDLHRGLYKDLLDFRFVSDEVGTTMEVSGLIQDGKFLFDMVLLAEAKKKLRKAIELDPKAKAADFVLNLVLEAEAERDALQKQRLAEVERAWNNGLPLPSKTLPTPNPYFRTNNVNTSSRRRQVLLRKLNTIVLDELLFADLPLGEAVRFLDEEVRKKDPEGKGINFIVNPFLDDPPSNQGLAVAAGAGPAVAIDLASIPITIDPGLRDVRLVDALNAIVKSADKPIRFIVEDYAIVFGNRPPESKTKNERLRRVFRVDANRFIKNMESMAGIAKPDEDEPKLNEKSEDVNPDRIGFVAQTNSVNAAVSSNLRKIMADAGVNLEIGQDKSSRTHVFFNDRTGYLMASGTLKNMGIIQAVVEILDAELKPIREDAKRMNIEDAVVKVAEAKLARVMLARVMIEVKFMEITLDADKTEEGQSLPMILSTLAPELKLTRIEAAPSKRADSGNATVLVKKAPNDGSIQIDDYSSHHWAGRLNPAQFRSVIRTFEQTDGVEVLSLPRITTKSGRQANVEVIDLMSLPTGLQSAVPADKNSAGEDQESKFATTEARVGVMLALLPYISSDRESVRMTVIPNHMEFLGFDELSEHIDRKLARELKKKKLTMAFPRIRVRTTVTEVVAKDGETIVIGLPMVTDEEIKRKGLFRRKRKISHAKHLVVFVTPTIVEPEGNPVNARK